MMWLWLASLLRRSAGGGHPERDGVASGGWRKERTYPKLMAKAKARHEPRLMADAMVLSPWVRRCSGARHVALAN